MRRPFRWDKKYLYWGITAFCVITASLLLYTIIQHFPGIKADFSKLSAILAPFIWGLVFSYLLAPLMRKMEKKLPKWLCVLICILLIILVIAALVYLIIPQLYSSLETIIVNSPTYIDNATEWIESVMKDNPAVEQGMTAALGDLNEVINDIVQKQVMPRLGSVVSNVTTGIVSVIKAVFNLIVGIIVSAYILSRLDTVYAGTQKILYSIFTIEAADKLRKDFSFVDRTFRNFFSGKLLDSLIIGLICYFFCAIVNIPYALLVSVIVGVTNIVPFFGPFIGAIPSAVIILMVNPVKCLVFIIFIIVLQQIDGNIIGPKILGNSIGINGFWVMFSIIFGGGLFGFWGMLLGVPVFVCIYAGIRSLIDKKLDRSDLPRDSESYVNLDYIDPITREVHKKKK